MSDNGFFDQPLDADETKEQAEAPEQEQAETAEQEQAESEGFDQETDAEPLTFDEPFDADDSGPDFASAEHVFDDNEVCKGCGLEKQHLADSECAAPFVPEPTEAAAQ